MLATGATGASRSLLAYCLTPEYYLLSDSVFRVVFAATEVLWWKPGHMTPMDVGVPLLRSTLAELGSLLNAVGAKCEGSGSLAPVVSSAVEIPSWDAQYIVSGARVQCSGGLRSSARALYRLTPRCWYEDADITTRWCVHRPAVGAVNGSAAILKVGSGFELTPVAGGKLLVPLAPVSSMGVWIVGDTS